MQNDETLYIFTVCRPDGKMVRIEYDVNPEKLKERAPDVTKSHGEGYTYKLWRCQEIVAKE